MKKMVMVLLCVMVLAVFTVGNEAVAAPPAGWFNCTLNSIGTLPSFYFLTATDQATPPAFTATFFTIDPTGAQAKAYLAAALTGYASGGNVSLYLPNGTAPFTQVEGVLAGLL